MLAPTMTQLGELRRFSEGSPGLDRLGVQARDQTQIDILQMESCGYHAADQPHPLCHPNTCVDLPGATDCTDGPTPHGDVRRRFARGDHVQHR
jgi:hypothetical protein